jgi:hypothetical protein
MIGIIGSASEHEQQHQKIQNQNMISVITASSEHDLHHHIIIRT